MTFTRTDKIFKIAQNSQDYGERNERPGRRPRH